MEQESIKTIRISKRNALHNTIKSLENQIQVNRNTVDRLASKISDFNTLSIKNIRTKILEMERKIENSKLEISDINDGKCDHLFLAEIKSNMDEIKVKSVSVQKKKESLQEDKKEMKVQLQKHYDTENKTKRNSKWLEKDMQRQYDYFCKINDSIPEYILENLRTMPSNKGYIYRNIWLSGELPPEKGNRPVIMFENLKGLSLTHEIYSHEIRVYKKIDRNRRELVKTTPRVYIQKP